MRRWLVLVGPPARLFASRSGDRSVCYELRSLSACGEQQRLRCCHRNRSAGTVHKMAVFPTVHTKQEMVSMDIAHQKLIGPAIENRTVMPRRAKNSDLRTREYLTEAEIEALIAAARRNRYGHRDATMILVAFRHGLRSSEVTDLRWDQVDFTSSSPARSQGQGGHPQRSSPKWVGDEGPAPTATEKRRQPFRVRQRARRAIHQRRVCQDDPTGSDGSTHWTKGSPPHAPACLRLRTGQCWP